MHSRWIQRGGVMFRTKKVYTWGSCGFLRHVLGVQDLKNSANPFGSSRDVISAPGPLATASAIMHRQIIKEERY